MKKIKLEDKIRSHRICSTRKGVFCIIGVLMFIFLVIGDGIQQQRFETLKNAYRLMENQKYEEAIVEFNKYLSVDSKFYWKMIEIVNEYDSSKQGVERAVVECKEKLVENR